MTLQERVNYIMIAKFVLNEDYKMTAEIINDEYVMCVKNGGKNDAPM